MEIYSPPFHITNVMLSRTASISEKVGEIGSLRDLEKMPHLRRSNRIQSIHASLKIEANSLSLSQVRDVINGRPVLGDPAEIQEVRNACAVYEKLTDINPYSLKELMAVHEIMTKGLLEESGVFRRGEEGVFQGDQCIFMAPPARLVPSLMSDLFTWMEREKDELHPLILSSVFHYEFVFIHPFADGNGRMARLWHTALLAAWKPVFAYIPLESQVEHFQQEYYAAISQCHAVGDSDRFVEFMLEQIDRVLDEVILRGRQEGAEASEYVKRLLAVMDYGIPYTTKYLMGQLGLKSRETFRKNYLNPAMELKLVEMTIPDHPTSRNQRYIRR